MASSDSPSSKSYSTDPALYLYTSLTAGSSHIVTATSRLETILRANRIPFKAIDIATDEKARMLWGRRAGKDETGRVRKLPGLVQMGLVLGDLVEIEEWNEYGELKQHVAIYYDEFTQPPISQAPKSSTAQSGQQPNKLTVATTNKSASTTSALAPASASAEANEEQPGGGGVTSSTPVSAKGDHTKDPFYGAAKTTTLPIRSIAEEAAAKAKQVRLQSLRNKVYGEGGSRGKQPSKGDTEEKSARERQSDLASGEAKVERSSASVIEEPDIPAPSTSSSTPSASQHDATISIGGLQSPRTGTWKTEGGAKDAEALLPTVQSPTSTRWRPTDIKPPVLSYHGSLVSSAPAEEIEAIERAQAIREEPEEEEDGQDSQSSGGDGGEEESPEVDNSQGERAGKQGGLSEGSVSSKE
ncbi:hypothetical protein VTK73DRAFT_5594 [Phialemonium thermophilum]|uniref:Glutaredoxin domain-containing protein n=1 Tax=Phialemonium thermophilum TaxID=223376 RepID=A0ABR3WMS7_9PEZI